MLRRARLAYSLNKPHRSTMLTTGDVWAALFLRQRHMVDPWGDAPRGFWLVQDINPWLQLLSIPGSRMPVKCVQCCDSGGHVLCPRVHSTRKLPL